MFYFLCRTRISVLHGVGRQTSSKSSQSCQLYFHKFSNDPSLSIFRVSNTVSQRWMTTGSNQESFTVSYLTNKLGFSPQSAFKASKRIHLKSPDIADTVISFLEKQGFSQSQIKTMVIKEPKLLASDVEKTFLPKLEYLLSKGFSRPDLAKFLCYVPSALHRSLERRIIPFFNAYTNLVHSDEKTVKAMKKYPYLISIDVDIIKTKLLSNTNVLRDHAVPESNILRSLYEFPSSFLINPGRFEEIVEKVEQIGFNRLELKFVHAVFVLSSVNKSILEKKVDAFKNWGWSDKEIWQCFRRYPRILVVPVDMIMTKMDFLVNRMGVDASRVVNQPSVLIRSFRKIIVPRGLFAQHLVSKGLIRDFKLSTLFDTSEKNFLKIFVTRYVAEAPELLKLYKANLEL